MSTIWWLVFGAVVVVGLVAAFVYLWRDLDRIRRDQQLAEDTYWQGICDALKHDEREGL